MRERRRVPPEGPTRTNVGGKYEAVPGRGRDALCAPPRRRSRSDLRHQRVKIGASATVSATRQSQSGDPASPPGRCQTGPPEGAPAGVRRPLYWCHLTTDVTKRAAECSAPAVARIRRTPEVRTQRPRATEGR